MTARCLLVFLLLSGCTASVHAPDLDLRPAPVHVRIGGGGFCPPGQAKKGAC